MGAAAFYNSKDSFRYTFRTYADNPSGILKGPPKSDYCSHANIGDVSGVWRELCKPVPKSAEIEKI